MSVLDLASATRASAGYVTLSSLPAFPEYVDSDNHTRALAERDNDGSIVVVFVRGAHTGIVDTFNERARLTHERSQAVAARAESLKEAGVDDGPNVETEHDASIAACDEALSALAKVRAQVTLHAARALAHYERAEEPDTGSEDNE